MKDITLKKNGQEVFRGNSKEASVFMGKNPLYIGFILRGERRLPSNAEYEIYFDGNRIEPRTKSEKKDFKSPVTVGLTFKVNEETYEVYEIQELPYGYYLIKVQGSLFTRGYMTKGIISLNGLYKRIRGK